MSNRSRVLLSLLILCVIAFGIGWRSIRYIPADGDSNMFTDVEAAAKKAKNNDENAIRELADAVFNHAAPMIPSVASEGMKDRLVRAEIKYRNGHKGVREEDIVKTVNDLTDKIGAPAYAKTSRLQVKVLRMRLMGDFPSFIAQERDDKNKGLKKKVGDPVNPEASPLEAAFITMMMIQQKVSNEDFQKTPEEFAAELNTKPPKINKDKKEPAGQQKIVGRLVVKKNKEKLNEMMDAIGRGVGRLGAVGAMKLADKSLDTLGIER